MLKYILKRLFYAVLTLFVIASITFFLMKALPQDPFNDPKLKPEVRESLREQYNLDKPVIVQYGLYLKDLAKGDLGVSMRYAGRSVNTIIRDNFPNSFAIGWRAMVFATVFGLLLGIIAALNHEGFFDYASIFIAIVGVSIPSIVIGPILSYFLGVELGWFPVTVNETEWSLVLPSFTLGLSSLALISRLMRSSTLEVLNQDYINTAKSKGLSKRKIVWSHVIRNAIMPVITVLGPTFASLITGSIVIENIFAVAGLGQYFVNSIYESDYSMIMGITIFYAALIILSMLAVDIVYALIDPRLGFKGKGGK